MTSQVYSTRERDIRKLHDLRERFRHELQGEEERGVLLDQIVRLEKKLGLR